MIRLLILVYMYCTVQKIQRCGTLDHFETNEAMWKLIKYNAQLMKHFKMLVRQGCDVFLWLNFRFINIIKTDNSRLPQDMTIAWSPLDPPIYTNTLCIGPPYII